MSSMETIKNYCFVYTTNIYEYIGMESCTGLNRKLSFERIKFYASNDLLLIDNH